MLSTIGIVAIGGAFGAVARHGVNVGSAHFLGAGFPWATLIVNVLGSFLMGIAIAKFAHMDHVSHEMKALIITGFLGAFTTFSTFSLDVVTLYERGEMIYAALYVLSSVVVSISALFAALWLMRSLAS